MGSRIPLWSSSSTVPAAVSGEIQLRELRASGATPRVRASPPTASHSLHFLLQREAVEDLVEC